MIPATSLHPLRYIGGMAALNLPSPTGTGDWHFGQTFERERKHRSRSFISGAGCLTDTTCLLGDAGIYEASELLRTLGIKSLMEAQPTPPTMPAHVLIWCWQP